MIKEFLETDAKGQTNLKGTVSVAGLGGNPYRDGSYAYYIGEKVISNDPKGVGAFLLAGNEIELASVPKTAKGISVALDCYFNNETIKAATGFTEPFHYKWDEKGNNGFFFFGQAFKRLGATLENLTVPPGASNLKQTGIYIIVDPDPKKETPEPNYLEADHISAITAWVNGGGVLVLMGNDSGNAEFEHFNRLAAAFGIRFNENVRNRVPGSDFQMGKIMLKGDDPVFKTARQIYIKELSTLSVKDPATAIVKHNGDNIMAVSRVGKGYVFAVGDPWLYNEYTDGRKLPAEFENYKAAMELAEWLVGRVPLKRL